MHKPCTCAWLLLSWLQPSGNNLIKRLGSLKTVPEISEALYLEVLSRPPEESETAELEDYLEKNSARRSAALGELAWALINSTEFRLNH